MSQYAIREAQPPNAPKGAIKEPSQTEKDCREAATVCNKRTFSAMNGPWCGDKILYHPVDPVIAHLLLHTAVWSVPVIVVR